MARNEKDELADALKRLSGGDAPQDDVAPSESAPLEMPRAAQRPARPTRPRVELAKPAVPISGKARPTNPQLSGGEEPSPDVPEDEISSSLANVIDDSNLSVGFEAALTGPRVGATRAGPSHSLQIRRTMIPILLTLGVCLPLIAAWWSALDRDSPLRDIGTAFPIVLLATGLVMLVLAAVNMLSVRSELLRKKPQ